MRVNRATEPKTFTNFYKPKQRVEARSRSNATIVVCIVFIIVVTIARGL